MEPETVPVILVVDDNPAGRYATSRVLRANGFDVREAADGTSALQLASSVDLVVLDVNLPDISGFEVCRRIRSTQQTARIPVIHLSATFVRDTDKVQGLEAGADGYLTHPVEPPVLVATVNAFLRTRRAEDEMRRSEAKFKAIFDQALSGILLVTKDLICLEANPTMCAILGRTREEIVGRHISSFVPAGHEPDVVAIANAVEERGAWRGTFPLLNSTGRQVELDWSIARHSVPGVRLAIVNDVTERRAHELERERLLAAERLAREEAERANRLKDEFLATLGHELRTPLNAIVGWSSLLKDGQSTAEDLTEGIDAISRNAQSQAQLISDLLDVSRITSGHLRLNVRAVDVDSVIRAAIETAKPAAQLKGIRIEHRPQPGVASIEGDPDRLQQVVSNLISNSVKFTDASGLICTTLRQNDSQTVIAVTDNGRGISAAFLPHIFERFRQEESSATRSQGGLGLGLAIVKHLVELHGGSIEVESAGEGRGASFAICLPRERVADSRPAALNYALQAPPVRASDPARLADVHVLIVDDDADARAVLRHILSRAGAQVEEAHDVTSALSFLSSHTPDLLISDIGMPGQDGFDLIRALRSSETARNIPAIALTAFAREEDDRRATLAGFQKHLSKPVDGEMLLVTVVELTRRSTSEKI